jgi:hypothetical protein
MILAFQSLNLILKEEKGFTGSKLFLGQEFLSEFVFCTSTVL